MAWATAIGPRMEQVEYRLAESAGCGHVRDPEHRQDIQVDYRTAHERRLEWIGAGLARVGLTVGTVVDDAGKDHARALMSGRHPFTGETLVKPKQARDPRGTLAAGPVVAAIAAAAAEAGMTPADYMAAKASPKLAKRHGRLARGVARKADDHRAGVDELRAVAAVAGIDVASLYEAEALTEAERFVDARVQTGNRGFDVTFDIPKSYSVLYGLAGPEAAAALRETYLDAVRETVTEMETWTAYAMRGHHGDGQAAARVDGDGFLGWMTVHDTARPVDGQVPDPHLHAHVNIAHLVHADGAWNTVAGGGLDIFRHVPAAGQYLRARLRTLSAERFGMAWERVGDAWEVTGVDEQLRDAFSKRAGQVKAELKREGVDAEAAVPAQTQYAATTTRQPKRQTTTPPEADLREAWRDQAAVLGVDADALLDRVMPGPRLAVPDADLDTAEVTQALFAAESGLTEHTKVVSHPTVMAAVADAHQYLTGPQQLAEAVADITAGDRVARLPRTAPAHLSHPQRYTTPTIIDAETDVLAAARNRLDAGFPHVDAAVAEAAMSAFEAGAGFALSVEQRAVVTRLTTASHGVDAVIGVAGSGKTTVMAAVKSAYQAAGKTVMGTSTAAIAADGLQRETGIGSITTARLLNRLKPGGPGLADVDVLVIDEAAMSDDRHFARIVRAAEASGTKVIGIGDPQQLRSPGVGSLFADVHQAVDGVALTENRRQRDEHHRCALALWRDGDRRQALEDLAAAGAVRAADTGAEVTDGMLAHWLTARQAWTDPHDQIAGHLMMAGTNARVDALNDGAQAIRLATGELDAATARTYRVPGGAHLTLHVGDHVMLRRNEYADRDPEAAVDDGAEPVDLLNGYRGVITSINPRTGDADIVWRQLGPDGPTLAPPATATGAYIRTGGVSLAYACTVHKAQGQTVESATVDLTGLDANAAYPALTRHRGEVQAWLAREALEDEATAIRLGQARSPDEILRRSLAAYGAHVSRVDREELVIAEIDEHAELLEHRRTAELNERQDHTEPDVADAEPEPQAPTWWQRPHGDLSRVELAAHLAAARRDVDALAKASRQADANARAQAAGHARRLEAVAAETERRAAAVTRAEAGHGPAQDKQRARAEAAQAALQRVAQARADAEASRALDEPVAAAQAALRDTQRRLNHSGLRRALTGTSKAELQQLQTEQAEQLRTLRAQRDDLDAAVRNARPELRAILTPAGIDSVTAWDRPAAAARAILDRHEQALADARTTDVDAADKPSRTHLTAQAHARTRLPHPGVTAPAPETVQVAQARLDALHAEHAHREAMPARDRLAEDTDRRQARLEARTATAEVAAGDGRKARVDDRQAAAQAVETHIERQRQAAEAARTRAAAEAARAAEEAQRDSYRHWLGRGPSRDTGPSLGL